MKTIITTLFLLLSFSTFATEAITENQENNILQSIDMACGDTWCEGDYQYHFTAFKCSSLTESCSLTFDLAFYGDDISEEILCVFEGITSYSQLMDKRGELTWDFYSRVNEECMADY